MVKTTEPKIENRSAQPYVGIRTQLAMQEMPNFIPQSIGEVIGWMDQHGIAPDGPPIIRYHSCPTSPVASAKLDITVGWPIAKAVTGEGKIVGDALPAGEYASLVFTGVENGVAGNGVLVEWAEKQGIQWDSHDIQDGEAFNGRVEYLMDGPDDDPNPSNWKTEVAIKTK